jgi:hypothetical protein
MYVCVSSVFVLSCVGSGLASGRSPSKESYRLSIKNNKLNSVAVIRKRTIPTERPPLVGEVSANLCG